MHLEELRIYQIAIKLRKEIYKEAKLIPNNWKNDDVRQVKRSSSSIPSNIAEGFGRRYYPKDFVRFLSITMASCDETKNHTQALTDDGHLTQEKTDYFWKSHKDLSIRIGNLITYLRKKHNLPPQLIPQ